MAYYYYVDSFIIGVCLNFMDKLLCRVKQEKRKAEEKQAQLKRLEEREKKVSCSLVQTVCGESNIVFFFIVRTKLGCNEKHSVRMKKTRLRWKENKRMKINGNGSWKV